MTPKNYAAVLSLDPQHSVTSPVVLRDRTFDMSVIDWVLKHADGSVGPRPTLIVAHMTQLHPSEPRVSTPIGLGMTDEQGGGLPVLIARHDTVEFKGEFLPSDTIEFNGMAADPGPGSVRLSYDASKCAYTFTDVGPEVAAKFASIEMPTDAELQDAMPMFDSMDTARKMRAGADGVLRSDSGMTTQEVIDSSLGEPGVAVTLSDLRELLTRADARGFPADPFISLFVKKYPAVVEHHEARYVEFIQRPCHCNAKGCAGCEQCEGCTCKPE